jgi:hypothetical protein
MSVDENDQRHLETLAEFSRFDIDNEDKGLATNFSKR